MSTSFSTGNYPVMGMSMLEQHGKDSLFSIGSLISFANNAKYDIVSTSFGTGNDPVMEMSILEQHGKDSLFSVCSLISSA